MTKPFPIAMFAQLAAGFALSLAVATAAGLLRTLTVDGAAAAVAVGMVTYGLGGWPWAALLITFFVTSSILTRWKSAVKPQPEHRRGRSAAQVLGAGGVAACAAIAYALASAPWTAAAFVGAIAASTADTWATEIGLLSRRPPRLITTGKRVRPGESGGVTWLGTVAGMAGAACIAILGTVWLQTPWLDVWLAGTLAMLLDSVFGATVERRRRWMTNEAVNILATATGAMVAALLGRS